VLPTSLTPTAASSDNRRVVCSAGIAAGIDGVDFVSSVRARIAIPHHLEGITVMPKKHRIEFHEVSSPIADLVTKFGGQPAWLCEPQWPVSRETGNPMRFICQIRLTQDLFPHATDEMAYLFMTDEEDGEFVDGTYEPDGGENAVILQPGVSEVPTKGLNGGPALYRMVQKPGHELLQQEACEFAVSLIEEDDLPFVPEGERPEMSGAEPGAATGRLDENKVGGTPAFMQGDEFPFEGTNRLLIQLDSCSVPFYVNFGDAGVGYGFLNEAGDRAKFLWQCG
jgi:Domain of unknown function (DUF1963)